MAKKLYKQGATSEQIDRQLAGFDLFGDCDIPDVEAPPAAKPAAAPKAVRLSWDPVERIDTDAAWYAFLSHV
jgi:hypothetical protein